MNKMIHLTGKTTLTTAPSGVLLLRVPATISDPGACEQFELVITRALATRSQTIVVDLSEAELVSTVVLGLLLKLHRGVAAMGGEMRLAGVQPMVRRVLNICRLDQLFGVFSTPEAAMAAGATASAI